MQAVARNPATDSIANWAMMASAGIAFVASLQLGTFANVRGAKYASTFTTGNLRTLAESVVNFVLKPSDRDASVLSLAFAIVCLSFFVGATIGGVCTSRFDNHAAWIVAGWLTLAAIFLLLRSETAFRSKPATGT